MREGAVVLGVTGGIAAYKSAALAGLFMKAGYALQVVMTENSTRFVTPLTFQTLSRRPVITSLWETADWQPEHVALADACILFVVAPATANSLAKLANGIADDALTTFGATYAGPTLLAPAMNPKMYAHPACVENVERLRKRGVSFIGPETGRVACGADGPGRMAEPEAIFQAALELLRA